jgi:hypothetical protein
MPKHSRFRGLTLFTVAFLLGASACGTATNRTSPTVTPSGAVPAKTSAATPSTPKSTGAKLCPNQAAAFAASNFPQQPLVDNPLLPLAPGTRLLLEGRADRGGGVLPHREVFIVTDLVKVINGVSNVVVFDSDIQDGEVAEAELAFFAQDAGGNVWNLGEYPEEYENGKFAQAPSVWFAGIRDATPGIQMKASPRPATDWYLQGWVPSIEFLDCGRVSKTDAKVCVPARCFTHVVVTEETSPLDPDNGIQLKYNAPGVGVIQVGAVGGKEGETMQLLESRKMTAKELATARASALKLEKRAYRTNPIYKQTKPST